MSPSNTQLAAMRDDPAVFQAELIIPSAHGSRRFGDVMADFQRERFASINPALIAVARGATPTIGRHWWEATKGASKDSDLVVCLLWLLAFTPRMIVCQVGAADQDQAGEMRTIARQILHLNPWLAKRIKVNNWKIICEASGASCDILAADIGGSHGARPDVCIVNELSHITDGKQEFAENLLDNAAKVPRGLVVVATNAGFIGTWQYQWRELAMTSDRWHFHQRSEPSPWLDPKEIAEAERRNSKSRFLRLWKGVWASGTGDALDPDDVQACITQLGPMTGDEKDFQFVMGMDLGIRNDRSALVVLGVNAAERRVRLAACEAWAPGASGQVDLEQVADGVRQANWQYRRLAGVLYDPHQCEYMAQQLRREGVNMMVVPFSGKALTIMAELTLQMIRNHALELYPDKELIRDLGRLIIVEKSYGYKLEAPRDASGHADRATALALALCGANDLAARWQPTNFNDGLDEIMAAAYRG